jgi:hypothetical protein
LSSRTRRIAEIVLELGVLLAVSAQAGGWVMFLLTPDVSSTTVGWVSFAGATGLLLLASALVWRFIDGRAALAALLIFTLALLLGDQLLGAPLSFTNFIGYTPLQSARYYGIGNEAAAFMVGTGLVGIALALDRWREARWTQILRRFGIPVVGALVVVATAAPFFGANVGVAIWGTVGFAVLWVRAGGRRITWKHVAAAVVLVVALIGAFAAADLLHAGEKTHLARSLTSAEQGGVSQLWQIVARKAQTNLSLISSTWTTMLLAVLGFLAFVWLRPARDLSRVLADNPAFGAAIAASLTAGVFAFFTEDTGILVPTFILLSTGLAAVLLVLSAIEAEEGSE